MAKLHFKYGAMNSGKSDTLIKTAYNYAERGLATLTVKPALDTKGEDWVVARGGARRRVQHDGARAQRGERPRQAHFLPVIHPLLAGRPAVKLRDDDGFHALPPVVLLTPAPRRARALWAVLSGTARR